MRRFWSPLPGIAAVLALLAVANPGAAEGNGQLDLLSSDIWVDDYTGLAIAGRDPVSYFTATGPADGSPGHELVWGGAAWRFVNEGNLEAFRAAPGIYAPRFGGHAVLALARRAAIPGEPDIWEIWNGQLYLFHSPVDRQIWRSDRSGITRKAVRAWRERLARRQPDLVVEDE